MCYSRVSPSLPQIQTPQPSIPSISNSSLPSSFSETVKDPKWVKEMEEEMEAIKKNGTWDMADPPSGKKLVGCKIVNGHIP